jgi:hypothetical protein
MVCMVSFFPAVISGATCKQNSTDDSSGARTVRSGKQIISHWWRGIADLPVSSVAQGRMDVIRSRLDKKLSLAQPGRTHRTEGDQIAGVLTWICFTDGTRGNL